MDKEYLAFLHKLNYLNNDNLNSQVYNNTSACHKFKHIKKRHYTVCVGTVCCIISDL